MTRAIAALFFALLMAACASTPPVPVEIDTRNDACIWCRMAIAERRFAAQIVAPGEEPKLFDEIGCLRDWLAGGGKPAAGSEAWVADHRTLAWVRASDAVYARVPAMATPMASGLAAWTDAASRTSDPDSRGGEPLSLEGVFPSVLPPGGTR